MSLIKDIIVYAILGAIQGFSEPIPISSSGHLVLFQSIFEFGVCFQRTEGPLYIRIRFRGADGKQ